MMERIEEDEVKTLDLKYCEKLAEEAQEKYQRTCEYKKPTLDPVSGFETGIEQFQIRDMDTVQAIDFLQSLEMPSTYKENLMLEQMICSNTADKWIFEYKLFLTLGYLSKTSITASEETDQAWHLHQTYTRHYRTSMAKYLKRTFKHQPTLGGASEINLYDGMYASTIKFYKDVFRTHPPDEVWGSVEARFNPVKFTFRNVNLFRLAALLSINHIDPDFLVLDDKISKSEVKITQAVSDNFPQN
mmetsp:Transcript_723/g.851  ORF Transcript_723/g.851 Transcript_723/m.851 type:complete len:244 (+) Transcript_723:613-1344(+)